MKMGNPKMDTIEQVESEQLQISKKKIWGMLIPTKVHLAKDNSEKEAFGNVLKKGNN